MSNDKSGALTLEMIENAAKRLSEIGGATSDRIISLKAHNILMQIRKIKPNWDSWTYESEIYLKAMSLGIKYE